MLTKSEGDLDLRIKVEVFTLEMWLRKGSGEA